MLNKTRFTYCFIVISILLSFSLSASNKELKLLWSIEKTFNMPESATFDAARQAIYISNVNQYAKDGNGFISKVSTDGKSVKLKWLTGLNSPTGLAIYGDILYAADYDALVAVNLKHGKIIQRYDAPDASTKPTLNDVAISAEGVVYVSGSGSRTIYRLEQNQLKVWLKDQDKLKFANGLFIKEDTLYHGGLYWNAFDIASRKSVNRIPHPDKILKDFDGITSDGNDGFLVTLIDDDRLWHIRKDGISQPVSEQKLKGIDLHYFPEKQLLLLPQVGGGLSAFRYD